MGDWLPENSWILMNVSRLIAEDQTKTLTRTISHQRFLALKGITDKRHILPDREITVEYIPSHILQTIQKKLKSGDIGAILYANKSDIFAAHMFMVIEKEGDIIIREASTSKMNTFDTEFITWISRVKKTDRYMGVSIMRVHSELDQPGKSIFPWQINALKNSGKLKVN
jgi:hypothetical protein